MVENVLAVLNILSKTAEAVGIACKAGTTIISLFKD